MRVLLISANTERMNILPLPLGLSAIFLVKDVWPGRRCSYPLPSQCRTVQSYDWRKRPRSVCSATNPPFRSCSKYMLSRHIRMEEDLADLSFQFQADEPRGQTLDDIERAQHLLAYVNMPNW